MNCYNFLVDDTATEAKNKIVAAFPISVDKDISFLQARKSGDLFKVKKQVTGEKIFKLTRMGSGCLNVKVSFNRLLFLFLISIIITLCHHMCYRGSP